MDKEKIKSLTHEFLLAIGENPERPGLKDTPERVAKMCEEIFGGIEKNPNDLIKLFKESQSSNNIIEILDIPVNSFCEHHLLPFIGVAHIKYIPKSGTILGLSKFARTVAHFSAKLQVQEHLTSEIAEFLFNKLDARWVEVVLECEHSCMTIRGIKARGSITRTTAVRGAKD